MAPRFEWNLKHKTLHLAQIPGGNLLSISGQEAKSYSSGKVAH